MQDQTAKARIRDAAIRSFGVHGVKETTARKVAEAAGVSPALVMHHFGSMDGLRAACDEYVVEFIRTSERSAASSLTGLDLAAAIREGSAPWLVGYLAAVLVDDSPAVEKLVDDMVADAEEYSKEFIEAGVMSPTQHPHSRAALLVIWSLGSLVLHRHLKRLVGVDLMDPDMAETEAFSEYALATYEIYGEGILTKQAAEQAKEAFSPEQEGAGA